MTIIPEQEQKYEGYFNRLQTSYEKTKAALAQVGAQKTSSSNAEKKRFEELLRLQMQEMRALQKAQQRQKQKDELKYERGKQRSDDTHDGLRGLRYGLVLFLLAVVIITGFAAFRYFGDNLDQGLTGFVVGDFTEVPVRIVDTFENEGAMGADPMMQEELLMRNEVVVKVKGVSSGNITFTSDVTSAGDITSAGDTTKETAIKTATKTITKTPMMKAAMYTNPLPGRIKLHTPVIAADDFTVQEATIRLPKEKLHKKQQQQDEFAPINAIFRCDEFDLKTFYCAQWQKIDLPFEDKGSYIEFTVPHFSAYAAGEIVAIDAVHLDADYNFISNVFDDIKAVDDIWSEPIARGEMVRVTFERNLTDGRVIDIFVRGETMDAYVEVYEAGTNNLVGSSTLILSPDWKYITVGGLSRPMDVFDLRITSEDPQARVEFDYIHDNVISSMPGEGILAYQDANTGIVKYRSWTAENFTAEESVVAHGGSDGAWIVLRSSYKRDEMILGIEDSATDLNLEVFNNTNKTGSWAAQTEVSVDVASSASRRGFDIAYEDLSGDALIVYENDSRTGQHDTDFQYILFNGSLYSGRNSQTFTDANGVTLGGRAGRTVMASESLTDTIMVLIQNTSRFLYGVPWTGDSFDTSKAQFISNATIVDFNAVLAFAWESDSGEGLAFYPNSSVTLLEGRYIRPYSPSTGWGDEITVDQNGRLRSVNLCSDPFSDYIGIISQDTGNDVNVTIWDGSSILTGGPAQDGDGIAPGNNNANVDCAWINSTSAMFGWSTDNTVFTYVFFHKPNTWSVSDLTFGSWSPVLTSGAIKSLDFIRDPLRKEMMILAVNTTPSLTMIRYNITNNVFQGVGESPIDILDSANTNVATFNWFRYDPAPNVTTVIPTLNSAYNANDLIEVGGNVTDNILLPPIDMYINITYPNGTNFTYAASNTSGAPTKFNFTFTAPSVAGTYMVTFLANDSRNSVNYTEKTNFTVSAAAADATAPNVTQMRPVANSTYNTSSIIEIAVNVTEGTTISMVLANISYPNRSIILLTLSNATTGAGWPTKFNMSFTIPQLSGNYNMTFIVNDTSNNRNMSESANFTATLACGDLRATTAMNQNVTSAGTCFTVNASNIILYCAGYQINFSRSSMGNGVSDTGFSNVTIRDCIIHEATTTINNNGGISISSNAHNATIYNNTFNVLGTFANGVSIFSSNTTNVSNNVFIVRSSSNAMSITTSDLNKIYFNQILVAGAGGSSAAGVSLTAPANENIILGNNITLEGEGTGISMSMQSTGYHNNRFINNTIFVAGGYSIYDNGATSENKTLLYDGNFGSINWTSGNLTTNLSLIVGTTIFIENGTLGVLDSVFMDQLNTTAKLTFRGLPYSSTPQLLKARARCDGTIICNITYDATTGILLANVSSFSNYTTNGVPTQDTPVLNTTALSLNDTTVNLTLYYLNGNDYDADALKNITNWQLNGSSVTIVNMPFESVNGTPYNNAYDYSGNYHDGTENGNVIWNSAAGVDGRGAYEFDGIDDFINITNRSSLDLIGKNFTISFWVKAYNTSPTEIKTLVMKYHGAPIVPNYGITLLPTGFLNFSVSYDSSFANLSTTAALQNGTWNHVVAVYNTTSIALFVNGVLNNTGEISITPIGGNQSLYVGGSSAAAKDTLNGTIDDLFIFNRSLSATQINAIFKNQTNLLVADETRDGDGWRAAVTINDGSVDGSTLLSNTVAIVGTSANTRPTAPVLVEPAAANTTTNRTPTFVWNNSVDADSDTITYNLLIDDSLAFNNPEVNQSAIVQSNSVNTSFTITTELNVDTTYFWKVAANDSGGYGENSSVRNFTIQSYLAFTLMTSYVDFNALSIFQNANTSSGSPAPFRAENTGNIIHNVTINASRLFDSGSFPSSSYRSWLVANETDSFNTTSSNTNVNDMPATNSTPQVVDLDWHGFKNDFLLHIFVTVPSDEPSGLKQSTVTFTVTG